MGLNKLNNMNRFVSRYFLHLPANSGPSKEPIPPKKISTPIAADVYSKVTRDLFTDGSRT